MANNDMIKCPLVDNEEIDPSDCLENIDVVDGMIKKEHMPEKFKKHTNWREICLHCEYHDM